MAKRKTVEQEHVAFLKMYFSKKLIDGSLIQLLKDNSPLSEAEGALRACLASEDTEQLNNWFDAYLSNQGRKTLWTGYRNVGYRKKNPRTDQELRKSVVDQVMAWAEEQDIDNLNDAVLALLAAQKK